MVSPSITTLPVCVVSCDASYQYRQKQHRGGIGYVIAVGDTEESARSIDSQRVSITTIRGHIHAEYLALLAALDAVTHIAPLPETVIVYSDCQSIVTKILRQDDIKGYVYSQEVARARALLETTHATLRWKPRIDNSDAHDIAKIARISADPQQSTLTLLIGEEHDPLCRSALRDAFGHANHEEQALLRNDAQAWLEALELLRTASSSRAPNPGKNTFEANLQWRLHTRMQEARTRIRMQQLHRDEGSHTVSPTERLTALMQRELHGETLTKAERALLFASPHAWDSWLLHELERAQTIPIDEWKGDADKSLYLHRIAARRRLLAVRRRHECTHPVCQHVLERSILLEDAVATLIDTLYWVVDIEASYPTPDWEILQTLYTLLDTMHRTVEA